jgi:hypothetical protein
MQPNRAHIAPAVDRYATLAPYHIVPDANEPASDFGWMLESIIGETEAAQADSVARQAAIAREVAILRGFGQTFRKDAITGRMAYRKRQAEKASEAEWRKADRAYRIEAAAYRMDEEFERKAGRRRRVICYVCGDPDCGYSRDTDFGYSRDTDSGE